MTTQRRLRTQEQLAAVPTEDLLDLAHAFAMRAHGERQTAANLQRMSAASEKTASRLMAEAKRRGIA